MADFNSKLEALSEHHDIPKVRSGAALKSAHGLTRFILQVGPG